MLAVGLQQAKNYSNKPCLLAKNLEDESKNVYWVPNAALPCLSCKESNPLSLVTKKQLFQLKKKFRVSDKVIKKVEKFYRDGKVNGLATVWSEKGKKIIEKRFRNGKEQ